MFTAANWFEPWNTQKLYQDKVKVATTCAPNSPIKEAGVVCGPIVRLRFVDYESGLYHASILIITRNGSREGAPRVEYVTGPAFATGLREGQELSLDHGEFEPTMFHTEKFDRSDVQFFRYTVTLPLTDYEQMVRYVINGDAELHYRFFIPSADVNFNVIAYSCNGFTVSTDTTSFRGSMWYDILTKHSGVHYNVMLGGGDQIYSDGISLFCEKVKEWVETKDPTKKYRMKADEAFKENLNHFYLKEYLEWYGYGHWKGSTDKSKTTQACFPLALATIPSINIWDDHDTIDGWGSYSDSLMNTEVFNAIGNSSYIYYMLFQHHVALNEKEAYLDDRMWVLGKNPGPFIPELAHSVFTRVGPTMAMLGLDCRTERKVKTIMTRESYELAFERLVKEVKRQKFDHLLLMLGVPIAYPRMVLLEWLFTSRILYPLKFLSRKGIIAPGFVNEFNGEVELLDDLDDHWCARHHKRERNWLLARLQDFGAKYGVRITILSGDVHLASMGRFRSKQHKHHLLQSSETEKANAEVDKEPENDERLMINVISSAVTNAPPPAAVAKVLQKRTPIHHFDRETDEDAVPLFNYETTGDHHRSQTCFLPHRNWSDIIPVKNVLANDSLNDIFHLKLGDRLEPGMVQKDTGLQIKEEVKSRAGRTHPNPSYPVTKKGVMATIHVETDSTNMDSKTTAYSMPIPELCITKEKLSHAGLKHLAENTSMPSG
ncbi:uncharacterized protein ZBAI_06932 [Zygosaccharomyces bailii ISA1307]|uniref:ZYBA0S07-02168g1_1 n=1 Tax=Zygosaccharomyces bailii (strain CLIB 213 / ATCC 58445 / CBS 680 / BCRC 21525 / NBRC 1098 / NCYC 1416 / NRRL Y-2227) TaxID=1333698 RepID=A0A8J2T8T0_ZYGB2|nr:ZYBA0S07-02168g1_1 [Zygosaccharomyces bailii CLIB 213]CDH15145.1 uncharacterized protein ZBAI_06932 [Zygosaccharomyces bailii ISA1307]